VNSSKTIEVAIRFREFLGSFVEHCHNTQHEDHAMLLRWDILHPGQTIAVPTPEGGWEGMFYEAELCPADMAQWERRWAYSGCNAVG